MSLLLAWIKSTVDFFYLNQIILFEVKHYIPLISESLFK